MSRPMFPARSVYFMPGPQLAATLRLCLGFGVTKDDAYTNTLDAAAVLLLMSIKHAQQG